MSLRRLVLLGVSLAAFAAAADASSEAIVKLLNSRAAGSPKEYAEAAEIVAKDAAAGRLLQQYVIALVSKDRDIPESARIDDEKRQQYLDAARDRIRYLAERKSNALSWYLLSLENNDRTMLKRAAEGGNVQALNAWGAMRLVEVLRDDTLDRADQEKELKRCFAFFGQAAGMKDANGLYNLGMCYLKGYGCLPDREVAFDCFRSAAEAGHPEAINNIGGFYRDGIVVEKDLVRAARWFKKSADLGNAFGIVNYAAALQRGEGVDKDIKLAVENYTRAAKMGSAEAMNALGMCFFNGEGLEKNVNAAFMWFCRSAALGYPPAMDNLATCYDVGSGVAKDSETATVWKVRARAARGDRNAAAWLLQNGHGLRGGK